MLQEQRGPFGKHILGNALSINHIARKYRKPMAHAQTREFLQRPQIKGCCVIIWFHTFRFDSTFQEWNPRLPGSRPAKVTPIIYGHYLSQHAGARARAGRACVYWKALRARGAEPYEHRLYSLATTSNNLPPHSAGLLSGSDRR